MKLTITVDLDNAAFDPGDHEPDSFAGGAVELAVGSALDRLRRGARETPVLDVNGNRVGVARVDGHRLTLTDDPAFASLLELAHAAGEILDDPDSAEAREVEATVDGLAARYGVDPEDVYDHLAGRLPAMG